MEEQTLVQRLAAGIATARKSANICVGGALPNISPGIEIAGSGPLPLPLRPAAAKRVMAACQQAPFGKGTQTLVDTRVRNALELSPARFALTNPEWDGAIRATVRRVAEQLGLPADRLEARLYKLLVYITGGFFLPHRDSEKSDRMLGSLIVALPTPFGGGALTVRHQDTTQQFDFQEAASGQAPCFAAFYADCEHEVSRVTRGVRLCLAYNLVLRKAPAGKRVSDVSPSTPASELAQSITGWTAAEKSEPLVFALDHHYTQRGLELDLLKGSDRETADLVIAAAEQAGCRAYLCQVSRHIQQSADDGRWDRRWRHSDAVPRKLTLGEIYEDDLHGEQWVDSAGQRQSFPAVRFRPTAIVASTPIDRWQPTREEYEGFTGNAGNTLDRWYHRSAVCVWHRDHHYDVLARAQVEFAIDMLSTMVAKWKKAPKKRAEAARGECIELARAIIRQWPNRNRHYYDTQADQTRDAFATLLAEIDDPAATRELLSCAARQDANLELGELIVAACRTHGCAPFAAELTALFATDAGIVHARNFLWLDQLACAGLADPASAASLAELARLAAAQFCQPLSQRQYYREDPTHAPRTLPTLLRVLLMTGDDRTLEEVTRFVRSQPARFPVQETQVATVKAVVPWNRKRHAAVHPLMMEWLRALQQQLSTATAQAPQPPADWARPAEIACDCRFCKQLNEILADPAAETGRVSAREDHRSHLIYKIEHHHCDVTFKLDKARSPHALVFTKTLGSFQRRLESYAADRKLLKTVTELLAKATP